MAVLVTSDWHLNDKPRDRYRHEWVRNELPQLIAKHNVNTLLMLGDLTDEFDNHSAALVNEIIDHLSRLIDKCAHIYLMRGNHDYVDPSCPFFKFIEALPRFTWINSPCVVEVEDSLFQFLPHTRNFQVDWAEISFRKVDICFAHNTFDGTISESGIQLSGIPPSVFPKDLAVISGDIHKRQDVGNITYVGSPYTVDFGDDFKPRVLLLTDGKVKSIACSGPQKRLVAIGQRVSSSLEVQRALKQASEGGDIVKLRVTIGKDEQENWPNVKRLIAEEALNLGVRLHSIEAVMPANSTSVGKYRAKAGKPKRDDEVLREYCKSRGVEDVLAGIGLDIIQQKGSSP